MPDSSASEIDRALAAAAAAWGAGAGSFSRLPMEKRLEQLQRLASALEERADAFADWHAREIGIPISTARMFAAGLGDLVRGIAEPAPDILAPRALEANGRRVELHLLPWGPAALYTAWNAPAFLAVSKLTYALVAGCPAVLKPSEHAGATTGVLVDALLAAELQPGAVQVVCGGATAGARIAADPRVRMINYTGGTGGGRAVAAAAIGHMATLHLELSAANPAIVTRDADLATTAAELARGATVLNGQWCEAPRRIYVDAAIEGELVALLLAELGSLTIGDPLDAATELGPLARGEQLAAVEASLERLTLLGDVHRSHESLPPIGCFFSPVVVNGLPLDAVEQEIFGPVLAVSPFDALEEAIDAANGLGDGLAAYVFAGDRDEAVAIGLRLHAGEIRLGGTRVLDLAAGSAQSFWGTSGLGGHGWDDVLRAHVGTRIVGEEDYGLPL